MEGGGALGGAAANGGEEKPGSETSSSLSKPPAKPSRPRYAEVYLAAESISGAERLLWDAMEQLTGAERSPDAVDVTVSMDRLRPETVVAELEALGARKKTDPALSLDEPRVLYSRWLD